MTTAIVEDHLILREVFREVCTHVLGHTIVAEAGGGKEAVEAIRRTTPELILLDIVLPDFDGFEVLRRMKRRSEPRPRVLLLSGYLDPYTVYRVANAEVDGFVDKCASPVQTLAEAIRAIASNGTYFSESFRQMQARMNEDPKSFDKVLTRRELVILQLVGKLLPDEAVARRLNITPRTAETHRQAIMNKLGMHSRPELIRYAQRNGFMRGTRALAAAP